MATWGDQTCQRFKATAVGFDSSGFSRLKVGPSNRYAIAPTLIMRHDRHCVGVGLKPKPVCET